jgi:hypothetical protein
LNQAFDKNRILSIFQFFFNSFRLDFCDDTIDKVHPTIAEALAFSIREGFFEKVLEEDLYENPEQVSQT